VIEQPPVKPVSEWSLWWVMLWIFITVDLLVAAFFLSLYDWMTVAAFEFGIPEAFGTMKQDDRFPPLTHVIVRYVPAELAMPLLYGFAGAIGAHWIGFPHPDWIGGIVGLIGWLDAHFLPRFLRKK
jgi:hypothetical protein